MSLGGLPVRCLRAERVQAALLYVAATLVLTYPTALRVFTHAVGDGGDTWHYVWAQWWLGYVSEHPGERLFHTRMLFHPEGISLYTHNLLLTHCILMWPVERLWGPVVAVNVYFLFSFWLSGMGAYLLVRYLVDSHPGALLAGLIYAFCPDLTAHALGHLGLVDMGWMPLFLLFLLRTLHEPGWRNPMVAAVVLVAQLYTDYTCSMFTLMLAGGWVILQGPGRWKEYLRGGAIPRLMLLGALVVLAFGPYFVAGARDPSVREFLQSRSWNAGHQYGAPLSGFFNPSPLHPLWGFVGWKLAQQYWLPISDGTVYLGWSVMPLAAYGFWLGRKRPEVRIAAVLCLAFLWISMGPTLRIVRDPVFNAIQIDDANVTPGMPFTLFHFIGPLRQLRAPARFIIIPMLLLAILSAVGLAYLREWARRRGRWTRATPLLWAGLVMLDFLAVPFRSDSLEVPTVYRKLATELPAGAAVMDIPWGCRDGLKGLGNSLLKSVHYQSVHERPLVGGYVTRLPTRAMDQYRPYPFLMETAEEMAAENPRCRHDSPTQAESELERLKIGVVVVHKKLVPPAMQRFIRQHLTAGKWESEAEVDSYFPAWVGS